MHRPQAGLGTPAAEPRDQGGSNPLQAEDVEAQAQNGREGNSNKQDFESQNGESRIRRAVRKGRGDLCLHYLARIRPALSEV